MPVSLIVEGGAHRLLGNQHARRLCAKARLLLRLSRCPAAQLSIVLSDDDHVRELNRRWRSLDRTTDVLSFPMDGGAPVLGDIVISVESARRQARGTLLAELMRLLVHGFFHLLGHDHQKAGDRRVMRRLERRALHALAGPRGK